MERRPMRRRPTTDEEARRTAKESAGANREDGMGASRLSGDPIEDLYVVHQVLLAGTTRHMQHVELRRVAKSCVSGQTEPFDVAHRCQRLRIDAVGRIRQA